MQGYDGTSQFYSPDLHQDVQLIEYGRLPNNQITPTSKTGTTYIDQANNQITEVIGIDQAGRTVVKHYKLIDLKQVLKFPNLQSITGFDGNQVHLDRLTQELVGPSMFHSNSYNIETVEKAINLLLKNQAIQSDNENSIIKFFKQLTDEQLSELTQSISKLIDERYYSKSEVDGKLKYLQQQINNLNNAVEYKPDSSSLNSVFPPSYTGDKQVDINDKIQDANIENKIDSLNQNLEKEKD